MAAPRSLVFGAFVDPEGWTGWFPNVRRAAYTSPPPFGVGTIRAAHVGGTRWVEEMIAWDDGRRWAWTVLRASVPLATAQVECFEFADAGSGTRIRWTLALDPRLIARLGAPFATGAIRRLLARAAANLEARLDGAVV
jgi:Polyketide cyclase / dehydrase and lipid transport